MHRCTEQMCRHVPRIMRCITPIRKPQALPVASPTCHRSEVRSVLGDMSDVTRRSLGILAAVLLCVGCSSEAAPSVGIAATATPRVVTTPLPSLLTSPEPTPAVTSPTSTPASSPTDPPVVTPTPPKAFKYSDILRVGVDGLAVRASPTRSARLLQGDREAEPIGDIRLDEGDFVSVELGPLPVGDTVWYLVWPAEDARLHYSTITWSTGPEQDGGTIPGWVAASVGSDAYLSLHRKPTKREIEEFMPVGLNVSGRGDYTSKPQKRHDLFLFRWAVSAENGAPCDFSVTLRPEDDAKPFVAVDTSTREVATSGTETMTPQLPWGPSAGGTWNSFDVSIKSGCTWTIRLSPLHHD